MGNFAYFLVISLRCLIFKINFFEKDFSNTIRVLKSLDPDQASVMLGMIWVQTVCKGYHQTTLEGKELIPQIYLQATIFQRLPSHKQNNCIS